jgi:hypothetical protein
MDRGVALDRSREKEYAGQDCMTETAPEHKLVLRPREITVGGTALLLFVYIAAMFAGMAAWMYFHFGDRITPSMLAALWVDREVWDKVCKSLVSVAATCLTCGVMLTKLRKRARGQHWEASSEGIGIHHDGQQVEFLPWKDVRWITRSKDRIFVRITDQRRSHTLEGMTKENYKKLKAMQATLQMA